MIIWDGVCSDDSKHSWTRQSITRICFWCGGKATSSGVGVYSGLSIIRCRVHGRSKCWDWVLCNRDSCVLQSVSSEAFVGPYLVESGMHLLSRFGQKVSYFWRCGNEILKVCKLAGLHEREWQPGILACKNKGVRYHSHSHGVLTWWLSGKMEV